MCDHYKILCGVFHGGATGEGFAPLKAVVGTPGFVPDLYAINRQAIQLGAASTQSKPSYDPASGRQPPSEYTPQQAKATLRPHQ